MAKHVENTDTKNREKAGKGTSAVEYPGSSQYQLPPLPAQGMTDMDKGSSAEVFSKGTKSQLDASAG